MLQQDQVLHDLEAVTGLGTLSVAHLTAVLPWLRTGWRLDLDAGLQTHWLPRARGSEVESDSGEWYFSGREGARQAICDWLGTDKPLLVVTGGPGSGKSAVLAHLLVAADRPVPTPEALPPAGTFAVAAPAGRSKTVSRPPRPRSGLTTTRSDATTPGTGTSHSRCSPTTTSPSPP